MALLRSKAIALIVTLACAVGCAQKKACPDVAIEPHATLHLTPPLSKPGVYHLQIEADGQHETCTIELSDITPMKNGQAAAGAPATKASTTCKVLHPDGFSDEGFLAFLSTKGAPESLSLTISFFGSTLVKKTIKPAYEPDRCGFIQPLVPLPLNPM